MAVDESKLRKLASGVPIDDQTTITKKDTGTVNSGDGATDTVIKNNRTRIDEIETELVNLGILTESGT